jgi:peptidoglycan/LPS O-acetylase OafA/YrhL
MTSTLTSSISTSPRRIGSLDALRAVAVISVLLLHLLEVGKVEVPQVFRFGWMGVDLFYVLSGFFIGSAVIRPAVWQPRDYARNRILRIVPAYYASMLITIAFVVPTYLLSWDGFKHILSHLLFVHNLDIETHASINGVYWTLGVEASFYVLMAFIAPCLRRSPRSFAVTIGLCFAVTYAWRISVYQYGSDDGFERFFIATQLPGMLDQFAIGIIAAYIHLKTDLIAAITGPKRVALGLATIFTCVTAFGYLSHHAGDYWFTFTAITFWRTWIAAGFAMAILFLLTSHEAWLDGLFRYSLLSYTGKISYSIYLYHIPVILSVTAACQAAGLGHLASLVVTVVTTWLFSSASYYLVEDRWHSRSPSRKATA